MPDRHPGEDRIHQVGRALDHSPAQAARTEPEAPAGVGHQPFGTAVVALEAAQARRDVPASEKAVEGFPHESGKPVPHCEVRNPLRMLRSRLAPHDAKPCRLAAAEHRSARECWLSPPGGVSASPAPGTQARDPLTIARDPLAWRQAKVAPRQGRSGGSLVFLNAPPAVVGSRLARLDESRTAS